MAIEIKQSRSNMIQHKIKQPKIPLKQPISHINTSNIDNKLITTPAKHTSKRNNHSTHKHSTSKMVKKAPTKAQSHTHRINTFSIDNIYGERLDANIDDTFTYSGADKDMMIIAKHSHIKVPKLLTKSVRGYHSKTKQQKARRKFYAKVLGKIKHMN
eukprot:118523_1